MSEEIVVVQLNARVPKELKKNWTIICKRNGWPIEKRLVTLLEDDVKVHADGNDQHLLTNFMENEDFKGFPSMAVDLAKKKEYVEKILAKNPELASELYTHVCEWEGLIKVL